MTSYVTPKKNTAFVFSMGLPSQGTAGVFQANPTIAAGDFKVSKDGGSLADLTNVPTVSPAAGKLVQLSLTATEMNADNVTIIASDAAGSEWCDVVVNIQTTAQQIDDLSTAATLAAVASYIDTEVAAIKAKTDALPPDPADQSALEALISSISTANENADALLDRTNGVETGFTVRQVMRLIAAVLAGKASGMGSTAAVFRDLGDTKDRIQATVDSEGNRTVIVRDVS